MAAPGGSGAAVGTTTTPPDAVNDFTAPPPPQPRQNWSAFAAVSNVSALPLSGVANLNSTNPSALKTANVEGPSGLAGSV
jgi:hypothetical protein